MTKSEIVQESRKTFGFVPGFIEQASEKWIVPVWGLVRDLITHESSIPRKYKVLIALGTASFLHGRYINYASREYARALGVSNEEIQDALAVAGDTALFSTWLNGSDYDLPTFEKEWRQMIGTFAQLKGLPERSRLESRDEVIKDCQEIFGMVPGWLSNLPDSAFKHVWHLFRDVEIEEGTVPPKYGSLVSLAVASVIPCRYCIMADTEAARVSEASENDIKEGILIGALVRNLETLLDGLYYDRETFMNECVRMIDSMRIPIGSRQ